jgi:hypothetical protein
MNILLKNDNTSLNIEYNSNKKTIDLYSNENVILFFTSLIYSFYHSIVNLYYLLYKYITENNINDSPSIIIPDLGDEHYYIQFIRIFIPDEKIIKIKLNENYKFNNIIKYDEVKIRKDFNNNKNKLNFINKKDFIQLEYINNILKTKIRDLNVKNKYYDNILLFRTSKSTVIENNRIFHNYDSAVEEIKKIIPNLYIFKPEEYTLIEQIYLMMNCKLLIRDWGSSAANDLWLASNSKIICLIHPWMAYFGNNQEKSTYIYTAKYLKLNFKCCYVDTYYKNKLISNKFIKREDTKDSWYGELDNNYKYIININNFKKCL